MKVKCPKHDDQVPSCEVYETHAWCFAGCGPIPLEDVGLESKDFIPKPKEDLKAVRAYIESLPKKPVRGLWLPVDKIGYYLTWPKSDYYKLRYWEGDLKYKNPSGHTQPLLVCSIGDPDTLYIVEGEINAMTIALVVDRSISVISPGSASNFMSKEVSNNLTLFKRYSNIVIVVDKDPAGTLAAIHLKSILMPHPKVDIVLMEQDANDVYVNYGPEVLKKALKKNRL